MRLVLPSLGQSIVLSLLVVISSAQEQQQQQEECGLYLAPSSTSTVDEPKWGVFAGIDYNANQPIGPSEVAVQVHHLMANVGGDEDEEDEGESVSLATRVVRKVERFIWVSESSAGIWELPFGRILAALPGIGMVGGYHAKLKNSEWNHSASFFRPPVGEIANLAHPGRGAYSTFYNIALQSTSDIRAGQEVFLDYGDSWGDDEEAEDKEEALTQEDHQKLDQVVDSIIDFMEKYKEELNDSSKAEIYEFLVKDVMGAAVGSKKAHKIAQILPSTADEVYRVKEAGGTLLFGSPTTSRSMEWLKSNGRCMDHMEMGPSTIPNAGRGAFAKRAIPKGGMIGPVPLLHLPDKSIMNMYKIELDEDGNPLRVSTELVGTQLLLNYCLGHPESSMLFFPSGSVTNMINHHSEKVNAKFVWSTHSAHEADWLNLPPAKLAEKAYQHIGLLMEVVATRDIEPGEEIFLDYGPEWQAAWDAYVERWNAKLAAGEIASEWPTRAVDLNAEYSTKPFKTGAELESDPYPDNVKLMCFLVTADVDEEDEKEDDDEDESIVLRKWSPPAKGTVYDAAHVFECAVSERIPIQDAGVAMPYNYTVLMGEETILHVPHQALVFVDKAGTSDQFTADPFRHPIIIPDDIFPQGPWRDLSQTN